MANRIGILPGRLVRGRICVHAVADGGGCITAADERRAGLTGGEPGLGLGIARGSALVEQEQDREQRNEA
jgi:hypothetical protein